MHLNLHSSSPSVIISKCEGRINEESVKTGEILMDTEGLIKRSS